MRRVESSFTSVSWIPSEAMSGPLRLPMDLGVSHYDQPPPDEVHDIEELLQADRCRFANRVAGWIEVDDDGQVVDAGHCGSGRTGVTTVKVAGVSKAIPTVPYPDLRNEPEIGDGWARFTQTIGGRTGSPLPRRTKRPPYVRLEAPPVWTTLTLTIHADGSSTHEVTGASPFPRHWFYDHDGQLVLKSGTADFGRWTGDVDLEHSPWSDHDQAALVAEVETALERRLSVLIMQGGQKPELRAIAASESLVVQGDEGDDLFLVLDGILDIEVDGEVLAQAGPGAILGERAVLEGGRRTATLRAATDVRVAVAHAGQVKRTALADLADGHRREEQDVSR